MCIVSESKVVSGHVAKRSDDVSGLGWGNVKTGFVSKKKLGFLQREMSLERDSNNSSPVPGGKGRGLRVTFADSPNGSRPGSNLGWSVAEMDLRAQTPPLAGEWAVAARNSSNQVTTANTSNSSFISQKSSTSQSAQTFSSQQSKSQSSQFSSVQKTSFSSSQSSSIQSTNTFEAFPGLGRIENLKFE